MNLYKELSKLFKYCMEIHRIVRISDGKVIHPTDEGVALLSEPLERFRMRLKYSTVCWVLGNKKNVPDGFKIIHINLDNFDYRLSNIRCIPKEDVLRVKEAMRNMQGQLVLKPHPTDKYAYLVQYTKDGKRYSRCFYDIADATRKFKQLQLMYAKILSKYHNTDF